MNTATYPFGLAVTGWIGEWALLAAGILLHALAFLVLYGISATRVKARAGWPAAGPASVGGTRARTP